MNEKERNKKREFLALGCDQKDPRGSRGGWGQKDPKEILLCAGRRFIACAIVRIFQRTFQLMCC